ncbi:hypothetical protein EDB92DRAFT_1801357, partial [Lactarius akahatsu]
LVQSFLFVNQPQLATDEGVYYGSYTRLLYYLFDGIEDPFEVSPRFHSNYRDSKRRRADDQMRDHFRDLRHSLVTPRLLGVSAFGTRITFYKYVVSNNRITIIPNPDTPSDAAPIERWNCDLLEDEGVNRICQVVQDVKAMCQASGN